MKQNIRERILQMIADNALDRDTVIAACLQYMSETDVQHMAVLNNFIDELPEEPDIRGYPC